ncbi:MAG TPA: asparagine synthase (glutamine-hydrolyzing) [Candidatus Udaeobacter sp.]|jgi:asparagine synthase (glutamine-hydrolysing)|nr:asparagine synthase (glutamine-hydrolyzing) [Candidatus Udaeobacter sp.]
MCGIAGLWSPRIPADERERWMRLMLDALRHRGPSGTATWHDAEITLGLARLAIVAPQADADIAASDSGHVHAVMNGEIYNHTALRGALRVEGHAVAGPIDTWVVPPLYQREGAAFPTHLDGMFAIAVWDSTTKRLLLARDRAGEKPLFITRIPGGWAFASQPSALTLLPWVSRDASAASLSRFLYHGFFSGGDSAWAAIQQVPPAHLFQLGAEAIEHTTRYWRPWDALVRGESGGRAEDAPAEVRRRLESAVESRVPEEVPFGVFLSGGVDSGVVATLASRAVRRPFPTFSLRLAHEGYDESEWAAEVARSIGSDHHVITMDSAEGQEALDQFAATMDQPLGDPSLLPTWALARLASRHVPVVLTGEGGDELFAGYPTYIGHRHARLTKGFPGPLRSLVIALARRTRPSHHHVTVPVMIERFLTAGALPPFERHWAWFGTASPAEARAFLAPSLRETLSEDEPMPHVRRVMTELIAAGILSPRFEPTLAAYQLMDFELYLPGALLTKVDRSAMAHGVESRAPFLRPSLIEFAFTLPDEARLRGNTTKWALKQAAHGLLPEKLMARRKQGFSPPFSAWSRGALRSTVEERLSEKRIEEAGVLDVTATRTLLRDHVEGRVERGRTLWTLLSLQMWAERRTVAGAAEAQKGQPEMAATV